MASPSTDATPQSLAATIRLAFAPHPPPRWAVVTGSGLGALADRGRTLAELPYDALPGIGGASVAGHAGRLRLIEWAGIPVLFLMGRRHIYEGIEPASATLLARAVAAWGIERLVLTNAAGGLVGRLWPGDLMLIADHLNLMQRQLLWGTQTDDSGSPPASGGAVYDPALRAILRAAALEAGIELKEGIYTGLTGPNYETRAEVRLLRGWGGDAVGMSTVPEALTAAAAGMRVAGISLITNSHVHPHDPPTHDEVLAMGRSACDRLGRLLEACLIAQSR